MSIIQNSSTSIQPLPLCSKELTGKINLLTAVIETAKNSIKDLNKQLKRTNPNLQNAKENLDSLQETKSALEQKVKKVESGLEEIKKCNFKPNEPLRIKEDIYRPNNAGLVKRILNGKRYNQEVMKGTKQFCPNSRVFSEATVTSYLEVLKNKISKVDEETNTLSTEYKNIASEQSELKKNIEERNTFIKGKTKKLKATEALQLEKFLAQRKLLEGKVTEKIAERREVVPSGTNENTLKAISNFSLLFETTDGCNHLNGVARKIYDQGYCNTDIRFEKVSHRRVYNTYYNDMQNQVRYDQWPAIESAIKEACKIDPAKLVIDAANAFYTPSETNRVTYRGTSMSHSAFNKLQVLQRFEANTFMSTSTLQSVAQKFGKGSNNNVKVMMHITGNSAGSIDLPHGLGYDYFQKGEQEWIYTPHAHFVITDIVRGNGKGDNHIYLQEIPRNGSLPTLPH